MNLVNSPKNIKKIMLKIKEKVNLVEKYSTETLANRQKYLDNILEVYRDAFTNLIEYTKTYSEILHEIKMSYDNAIQIRDERIKYFISQDVKMETYSDYLELARERDARYTLYFENLALHMKIRELDGSAFPAESQDEDPVMLRIALDRCREQLSSTQLQLKKMADEYAETVPRREYEVTEARLYDVSKHLDSVRAEYEALHDKLKRVSAQKKSVEEELSEVRDRCRELERAATPRPQWELCGDYISGGRDRWLQLCRGLTSRDALRALLKELGPTADGDNLEHFDGLGMDPVLPPYLRYSGRLRNLRLSRREVSVLINDIWSSKADRQHVNMQQYVTDYFEDRYQQPSVRAEWAYNLCASAEQMLDEPQVRIFWGVLHGQLSEQIYWGLRSQWGALRERLYARSRGGETVTIEEFEKVAKALFPLKSEVEIRNLTEVARKQLKVKVNQTDLNLDKLFSENEEGFERVEFARELYRQRQQAQDKYLREVVAELRARSSDAPVTPENLKRAFAIVDPAIDHIRMERHLRWTFGTAAADVSSCPPLPLKTVAQRLASGDVERAGPRGRTHRRHYK